MFASNEEVHQFPFEDFGLKEGRRSNIFRSTLENNPHLRTLQSLHLSAEEHLKHLQTQMFFLKYGRAFSPIY